MSEPNISKKTLDFIDKSKEIYGDSFDYSKTEYANSYTKVCITCRKHGDFYKNPDKHINRKQGCPDCSQECKRYSKEEYVEKCHQVHGSIYDYHKVDFGKLKDNVIVTCSEHGDFEVNAGKHIKGHRCPLCIISSRRDSFIEKASIKHNNYYSYDKSKYTAQKDIVTISCPVHGDFKQRAKDHLAGKGCRECANIKISNARQQKPEDFIEKAKEIHGDKYNYTELDYSCSATPATIRCPKHGEFKQIPTNHLQGKGCPKCARDGLQSRLEADICSTLDSLSIRYESSNRKILDGKELDIFIPDSKIAIEFNGLYWHSDLFKDKTYHLNKLKSSLAKNIRLIQIFEDEWVHKRNICLSRLCNILNKTKNKIFARKTEIKEVKTREAMVFLEDNHIQGKLGGKHKLGLFYKSDLVSLMTFGSFRKNLGRESKQNCFELLRFCNKLDTTVVGGASKLFTYFVKNMNPQQIISYADRRWSVGHLYESLGFVKVRETQPNYFYTKGTKRENRFKYRKSELVKQGYDPQLTEKMIMQDLGYYRIHDCGNILYKWEKNYVRT